MEMSLGSQLCRDAKEAKHPRQSGTSGPLRPVVHNTDPHPGAQPHTQDHSQQLSLAEV